MLTAPGACAQILSGVAQPVFQVLIPGYSEKWFDLRQRTTATMLMSICASSSRSRGLSD